MGCGTVWRATDTPGRDVLQRSRSGVSEDFYAGRKTMPKGKKAILIDARIDHDPRIIALPSDAARWGFVVALTEAKWTTPEGIFGNREALAHALGVRSKFIAAYLKVGLLTVLPTGEYTFTAWADWQQPSGAAERMQRWRQQKRDEGAVQLRNSDVTVTSRVTSRYAPNANANANAYPEVRSDLGRYASEDDLRRDAAREAKAVEVEAIRLWREKHHGSYLDASAMGMLRAAVKRALVQATAADVFAGLRQHADNPRSSPRFADQWAREAQGDREEREHGERMMAERDARLAEPMPIPFVLPRLNMGRKVSA